MPPRSRNDEQAPTEDTDSTSKAAEKKDDSSSSGTAYLNVSGTPIVYDRAGHQVGAGEWTPEINLDKVGRAARQNGYLLPRSEL